MKTTSTVLSNDSMSGKNQDKGATSKVDWVPAEDATLPVVIDSQCVIRVPELVIDQKDEELSQEGPGYLDDLPDPYEEKTSPSEQKESSYRPWSGLSCAEKVKRVVLCWAGQPLAVLALLYMFICSLDLLSSGFRLLGGKAAGNAFSSNVLVQNPVAGLMIGIIATVLVQSSSTSTSIAVAMVSSGILGVRPAIPIIMGANIGTSVTNTIVSLGQSTDRGQFKLAFSGATVHDMFNWLAVIVFLPLEIVTGYLYHSTKYIVDTCDFSSPTGGNKDILKAITKPFTNLVIQIDKNVIKKLALGHPEYQNKSLLKEWCGHEEVLVPFDYNQTDLSPSNETVIQPDVIINGTAFIYEDKPTEACEYLFKLIPLNDTFLGLILMLSSLTVLIICLVLIVKILQSALKGPVAKATHKIINKDFPGKCSYFTGYVAILIGACLTIVVQSSSVFTSTLTPLVGLNIISLERMYPLTLGSNIGTTTTGLLAAMAASGDKLQASLQIALVHLFFNISGILLFYPIPAMRFPIPLAKMMGETTAKYRWFAIFYMIGMFFLLPGSLFALSMAGTKIFAITLSICVAFVVFLTVMNILKKKFYGRLSRSIKKFVDCLPKCFYSLQPMDNVFQCIFRNVKSFFMCRCCCQKSEKLSMESKQPMLHPYDSSVSSSNNSTTSFRKNFIDEMSEEERLNYESTVRSLEEVKVMLTVVDKTETAAAGTDSGYVTQMNTPYISKVPSREDFSDI